MKTRADRKTLALALAVFVVVSAVLLCGADCDFSVPFYMIEDMGNYWAKGTVDPQLAGQWYKVEAGEPAPDADPEEDSIRFTRRGDEYELASRETDDDGKREWKNWYRVKTLNVGKHAFMMWKPSEEVVRQAKEAGEDPPVAENHILLVVRYTLEKDVLKLFSLKTEALEKAAKDKRWADVLKVERVERKDPGKEKDAGREVEIVSVPKLDENTVKFLGWLAEDPENWETLHWLTRKPPEKKPPEKAK